MNDPGSFAKVTTWTWHFLWGLVFPLSEAALLLIWIVGPSGYVFFGDTSAIVNPGQTLASAFSVWNGNSSLGTSTAYLWLPFYLVYTFVSLFAGAASASRILTVVFAAIPGIFMYASASLLGREWLGGSDGSKVRLFAIASSQVYLLSFVNQGLWNPFNPWTFSYSILPLVLAGFWLWMFHGDSKGLVLLGAGTILSSLNPFWIEEAILLVVPIFLATALQLWRRVGGRIVTARLVTFAATAIIANLFWIVPTFVQFQIGTASYSQSQKPLNFDQISFLSSGFHLLDVLLYGHSAYQLFGLWQQNWTWLNVIPVGLTYLPFMLRRKPKAIPIALGISLIIGVFLAKGTNPPFGSLFLDVGRLLPLGFGTYFRNGGNIFLEQVLASASLLIGFAFDDLSRIIRRITRRTADTVLTSAHPLQSTTDSDASTKKAIRRLKPEWRATFVLSVILLATLIPIGYGSIVDQRVFGPRLVATEIPLSYSLTNSFLQSRPGSFNVAWFPNGCCNVPYWKPYILTNFPATLSARPVLSNFESVLGYAYVPHSAILSNWLALLGVRYVVVHSDFLGINTQSLNESLRSNPRMRLAFQAGFIEVYEVLGPWSPQDTYVLPTVGNYNELLAHFDGTQFIALSHGGLNGSTLDFPANQDFSVASWVKTNDTETQAIIQNNVWGGTWAGWILGMINQGRPWFQAGQTSGTDFQGVTGNWSIADGAWHFLVGERNGSAWRLFVDGKAAGEKLNMPSISLITTENASIGARATSHRDDAWFLHGSAANIEVFTRALTQQDIVGLYDDGLNKQADVSQQRIPLLWTLPFAENLTSLTDHSANGFLLKIQGLPLRFTTASLPLDTINQNAGGPRIVSSSHESSTNWQLVVNGTGQATVALANPYAPGWQANWQGGRVRGFPLFGGAVIGFNVTLSGITAVQLSYVYQNALLAGTIASLLGFPGLIAATIIRRSRTAIRSSITSRE